VFGAFTWTDADRKPRELDLLEIGMFGSPNDGTNAQYAVQPWTTPGNLMRIARVTYLRHMLQDSNARTNR
jgi:hypothetical protein